MNMKKVLAVITLALALPSISIYAGNDKHGHKKEPVGKVKPKYAVDNDKHDEGVIKLNPVQMKTAGIVIKKLIKQPVFASLQAPAEVSLNAYRTIKVTPRIASQVLKRHARLGDVVRKGQVLLTLSSVEMAAAQSELLIADREWQRVRKLGRKVVSGRRFTEATIARSQALSKVKAYGMTVLQIKRLLKGDGTVQADGTFQLISSIDGRILHDDFIVGEHVDAGKELMVISDESVMWVEARITPDQAGLVKVGNTAQIKTGKKILSAKISQIHHALDETTRTLAVRMEINNPDDFLHPGMFVNAIIQTSDKTIAFVLPEAAVLRSPDGDWQVFVEQDEPGEFKAVEVELLRVSNGMAIIDGLKNGMRVVTKGAFFVQSELAKSGFEIHDH